jgi:hypothetical protein
MTFKRPMIGLGILLLIGGLWLTRAATGYPSVLDPSLSTPKAVLIDNVRLISMAMDAPEVEDQRAVLVVGDEIKAVGDAGALTPPDGALIVDGTGKTLLPGLIDAHVHLWDEAELAAYLAHGVTGVRNMSGMPFHLPLGGRIASGEILGPDFQTTGPILNSPGPNDQIIHKLVTTAPEARAAVIEQYDAGYRDLKVYSNLTPEAYRAILVESRRLGMSVSGHTPEGVREPGMPIERPFSIPLAESLGQGFVTLEHVETVVWHGLRGGSDEDQMRELAVEIAASAETVTATLIAHDNLVRVAASNGEYLDRPGVETISPLVRWFEKGNYEFWSEQDPANYEGPRGEFFLTATRLLHEAGVPLIAGTDGGIFTNIPGSSMTRELELLVKAGLSPHEALASATRISADALGFEKTGVVAPGYRANLMLLSDDPLNDISVVETPSAVMIGGYWLDEASLADMQSGARDTSFVRSARRAIAMWLNL